MKKWFKGAFKHIRLEGYGPNSTGRKLLELLTGSLQTFGSVANHAPDLFELLKKEAQDQSDNVRQAALKALSTLLKASPVQAQAALPVILEAAKDKDFEDKDSDVRQAALKALSTLLKASPLQAQAALPSILEALKDRDFDVRQAALASLWSLIQGAPARAQEALPSIPEALKDRDFDVRQAALKALSKLLESSPARAQAALTIIREVFTAEDGSISEVALGFLSQASLEQLLAHYWSKPDASLIPYIHPRLYHTPLVVGKSSQPSKQQVTLYAIAGEPERYPQPAGVVQDFVDRIKAEAS